MKRILLLILLWIIYYLMACFIYGGFDFINAPVGSKFLFVFLGLYGTGIYFWTIILNDLLLPTPHTEKVTGIKKYIGELHEQLKLYADAKDLEKRVNELRNK